jgi:hypothetical protein
MAEKTETPTANLEKIEEKLDKGEALTADEEKLIDGPADPVEEIDPETIVLKKEEKESKPADTPAEKDAKAPEAKKQEGADTATQEAERKKIIEEAAEKPLDEVDIKDYSPTERALFFELRKERRKRQESQAETDTLKFQRAKEEAKAQLERERVEAEAKAKEEADHDPFQGLEDDDLLTAGQIKKILAGKKESSKPVPESDLKLQKLQMENWALRAKDKAPDLQMVLPYADTLLINDEEAKAEVAEVFRRGGNVVLATYNLIKSHPKWPEIEAKIKADGGSTEQQKKADEEARTNKERAERIEANKKKPVTTGSGGGAAASGDYSIQELLDMPEHQFAKLPKSQRDRILETF